MNNKYRKLRKPEARKLFNQGVEIWLLGDNTSDYHLIGGYSLGCPISLIDQYEGQTGFDDFDGRVANFQFNLDAELGRRAAYFVLEGTEEKQMREYKAKRVAETLLQAQAGGAA